MERLGDTLPYRGIEFGVQDEGQGVWSWAYYPKIGAGIAKTTQVTEPEKPQSPPARRRLTIGLDSKLQTSG
jgi:hypothetical protein